MRILRAVVLALCVLGAPAGAQLTDPSAASLGLGAPRAARARGFSALSANPAGLGARDRPVFTMAVLPVRVGQGLEPVDLGDLARYSGRSLPPSVREAWLQRVAAAGSQVGGGRADVTLVAVSRGNLAAQVGVEAFADARLNPDAMELLLFGNTGRDGAPGDFVLGGSTLDGFVVTTVALAGGWPVGVWRGGSVSLGATVALTLGNALLVARDNGSSLTGDPLEFDIHFPVLEVSPGAGPFDAGRGVGLDLGALWQGERLGVGLSVRNVFNTFRWDLDHLSFRPGSALFDADRSVSDFQRRPGAEAPPLLLDALPDLEFEPLAALGASYGVTPALELSADVRGRLGDGSGPEPRFFAGAGAEYEPDPRLRFQGGLGALTGAIQASGGLTVILDSVHLGAAVALRRGDGRNATVAALTVSVHGS